MKGVISANFPQLDPQSLTFSPAEHSKDDYLLSSRSSLCKCILCVNNLLTPFHLFFWRDFPAPGGTLDTSAAGAISGRFLMVSKKYVFWLEYLNLMVSTMTSGELSQPQLRKNQYWVWHRPQVSPVLVNQNIRQRRHRQKQSLVQISYCTCSARSIIYILIYWVHSDPDYFGKYYSTWLSINITDKGRKRFEAKNCTITCSCSILDFNNFALLIINCNAGVITWDPKAFLFLWVLQIYCKYFGRTHRQLFL